MVFPKNCDITAGNTQDVNDHLLTGGSISRQLHGCNY